VHNLLLRIFAPLRNEVFHSLSELNHQHQGVFDKHNATPMQRYGLSREERFEQEEKAAIEALAPSEFVVKNEVKAKVQRKLPRHSWRRYAPIQRTVYPCRRDGQNRL